MAEPASLATDPFYLENPQRRSGYRTPAPPAAPLGFHARLPGYYPTRLARLDSLADELGIARLLLKDESYRLGLPAFKVLGVSWAMYRAFCARLGADLIEWSTLDDLRAAFAALGPMTVTAATDGNHGRALARVARWLGASARIYAPAQIPEGRAAAIRAEGAELVVVDGTYDDAVATVVSAARDDHTLLISDVATTSEDVIPRWIVEGYSTMFREIDEQLAAVGEPPPDIVLVQIGVGALAGAAALHYRREGIGHAPTLVGVEPLSAACLLESARAGGLQVTPGPHTSAMDCLNAGAPSVTTLPAILATFDAFIAVDDDLVASSIQSLAGAGVVSGPTGCAGLVGLRAAAQHLELTADTRVLLINTEGSADPGGYAAALNGGKRGESSA